MTNSKALRETQVEFWQLIPFFSIKVKFLEKIWFYKKTPLKDGQKNGLMQLLKPLFIEETDGKQFSKWIF